MDIASIATVDDLVVGLLLGTVIGLLASPILRARIAYREWSEARREATLTDELLARLEALDDEDLDALAEGLRTSDDGAPTTVRREAGVRWRTSR